MPSKADLGLREYLKMGGSSRLIGDALNLCSLIAVGELLSHAGRFFPAGTFLGPILKDPFTVLAYAILTISYTDLDFMKFKLSGSGAVDVRSQLDPLFRQEEIPKRYREVFGADAFFIAWQLRLCFILSFAVAGIRWLLNWQT